MKVHFENDYEELLADVMAKINKDSIRRLDRTNYNLNTNTNINFYTSARSKNFRLSQTQQMAPHKFSQTDRPSINKPIQSPSNTTYYVFGQSSPAKSV